MKKVTVEKIPSRPVGMATTRGAHFLYPPAGGK